MYSPGTKFTITFLSLPILSNSPFSSILPRERTSYSIMLCRHYLATKETARKVDAFCPVIPAWGNGNQRGNFNICFVTPKKERQNLVSAARIGKLARYPGAVFALRPSIRTYSMKRFQMDSRQGQYI